jgi:uncharacterized membrane protein
MKWLAIAVLALMLCTTVVFAVDFSADISDEDKETFDSILEPVMKVYNFIKYSLSVLAVLFMLFAAGTFIVSGRDQSKRESAKTMMIYIIFGLIIIWVAPLIVEFLVV